MCGDFVLSEVRGGNHRCETGMGRAGTGFMVGKRISRESRLLNILNRRIFLQRNTYLSVKVALFPDGMLKLVGLSGEMADFPDESHNLR